MKSLTQDYGGQLEVNEETDDAEVHEGMRRRDEVRFLIDNEHDGSDDARFRGKRRLHEFHRLRCPESSKEPLEDLQER